MSSFLLVIILFNDGLFFSALSSSFVPVVINIIESIKAEEVYLNDIVNVKGKKPISGKVRINEKGKVNYAKMIINSYNVECENSSKCEVGSKINEDNTVPEIEIKEVESEKNSITIKYETNDEAKVICEYGTDTKYGQTGTINEENNKCTINNLESDTSYYYRLTPKINRKGESKTGAIKTKANVVPATEFKVGDYVYMVPTMNNAYTPTTDSSSPYYTGTNNPGSITPSELDTWVIIRNDSTGIEMVSLNVSSTAISFYGQVGYKNLVGALNEIARQYTNENFVDTSKIRHMGDLPGSSIEQCDDLCGSDIYYEMDTNLVKSAMKIRGTETLVASEPKGNLLDYFLASRLNYQNVGLGQTVCFRYIGTSGGISDRDIWNKNYGNAAKNSNIRPILTLKEGVVASATGDGSEDNPWVLVEQ